MKICVIYHSETGNTRHVAQHIGSVYDAKLVEVRETANHSRITRFLSWCKMARGEELTPIEPAGIDVSTYDLIVFGSPVWAFKPTPVIHAAIIGLKGCEGKRAVAFGTHGGRPGQMGETLIRWINNRGMRILGIAEINQKDIENDKKTKALISLIESARKA
ncbi:MAG: ArsR family transcriptional regulator [Methanoregula sp.]|jgi:flavodoxin|nr:ArsR family transcriptional regulator [Methanoregula sp.]